MVKHSFWHYAWNYLLLTLGSFLIAFGNAIFLTNLSIDAGGLSGIGIIVQYYILYIHPYFDFNGRTARMAFIWILYLNNMN